MTRLALTLAGFALLAPFSVVSAQVQASQVSNPATVTAVQASAAPAPASHQVALPQVPAACGAQSSSALPLRPTRFSARRENKMLVELDWRVEDSEYDIQWVLERRLAHEADFTEVQPLPPTLLLRERYTDANTYPGNSYYRLRGLAADGHQETSPIRVVGNDFLQPELRVYPTPLRSSATVYVPVADQPFGLLLTDHLGRKVWDSHYPAGAGPSIPVRLPRLPPGMYALQWMVQGKAVAVQRVVVAK